MRDSCLSERPILLKKYYSISSFFIATYVTSMQLMQMQIRNKSMWGQQVLSGNKTNGISCKANGKVIKKDSMLGVIGQFLTPFIVDFFLLWGEISNFLSFNLKKHIRTKKIVSSGVEGTLERCLLEVFLYHLKKLLYLLHVWNKKFLIVVKNNLLCLKHCTSHNTTTSGLCLGTLTKTIWIFSPASSHARLLKQHENK